MHCLLHLLHSLVHSWTDVENLGMTAPFPPQKRAYLGLYSFDLLGGTGLRSVSCAILSKGPVWHDPDRVLVAVGRGEEAMRAV